MSNKIIPLALFDSIKNIDDKNDYAYLDKNYDLNDITIALKFLKAYKERRSGYI